MDSEFVIFIILVIVIIFSIIVTLIITKGNYRASYEPIKYKHFGGVETDAQKHANYLVFLKPEYNPWRRSHDFTYETSANHKFYTFDYHVYLFGSKGGKVIYVPDIDFIYDEKTGVTDWKNTNFNNFNNFDKFKLQNGDILFPLCTDGENRSQVAFEVLNTEVIKYTNSVEVKPVHAVNGQDPWPNKIPSDNTIPWTLGNIAVICAYEFQQAFNIDNVPSILLL